MSRKRQTDALKFILGNSIILRKLGDALGCEKKMSDKELKVVVKDMIKTYAEETCTDSFTVNMFGPGEKKFGFGRGKGNGYRDDRFDEDWDVERPKTKKPKSIEDLIYK